MAEEESSFTVEFAVVAAPGSKLTIAVSVIVLPPMVPDTVTVSAVVSEIIAV